MGYTLLPEAAQASIRKSWDAVHGPDGKAIWGGLIARTSDKKGRHRTGPGPSCG